jgi:hypothetical protein
MARLYLARGEKEKSAQTLDALLVLWQEADPEVFSQQEAHRLRSSID